MNLLSRRHFLKLSSLTAAGLLAGCAANPVTGRSQLMLVSENQEISIDKKNSPHQLSSDYGVCQDKKLNAYIQQTGNKIAALTHRPEMPYAFKCVNAVYVNAYAFPGGTIAATRGILLAMETEAELAALLGHELGHINARHTAEQMSKGTMTQLLVGGLSIYASTQGYGKLSSQLGSLGAGALLASYSRSNEREADALALEYMTKAGYNPAGIVDLMEMLNNTSKKKPNAIELMFSTHPMSSERLKDALEEIDKRYKRYKNNPLHKERYMDNTAALRTLKEPIEEMQKAEKEMAKKNFTAAEQHMNKALQKAANDYTALAMMAKLMLLMKKPARALHYSERAREVYPEEAQGHHLGGLANLQIKKYQQAYENFSAYNKVLPNNPGTLFYQGRALEGMQRPKDAARHYASYLKQVDRGQQAQYAQQRLVDWGYIKKK